MREVVNSTLVESLPFQIFIFIFTLLGLIFNSLVILVTKRRSRQDRAIDSQLIFLIATFDCLISIFLMITLIIRWSTSDPIGFLKGNWCPVSSVIYSGFSLIALTYTAQLSIIRYLAIVRSYSIRNVMSTLASVFIFIIILLIFIVAATQSNYRLMPSGMFCLIVGASQYSGTQIAYSSLLLILAAFIFFSIPICYGLMSLHYYRLSIKCANEYKSYRRANPLTFILPLVLVCLAYTLALIPEFSILIYEAVSSYIRDFVVDSIIFTLFLSVTWVNPLFVLTLHPESRNEMIALLRRRTYNKPPNNIDVDSLTAVPLQDNI